MRARNLSILLLAAAPFLGMGADSSQPHIKTARESVKADGVAIEKTNRWIYLENGCTLSMTTHNEEGKNTLVKKKWGDFLFGLSMGRLWNGWDFLQVSVRTPKGPAAPVSSFLPSSVTLTPVASSWMTELKWPVAAEGDDLLRLVVFQFPSHKNWLFFRLEATGGCSLEKVSLPCYPATSQWANVVPERERIAATKENLFNLSKDKHEFAPKSPGIILYNKYVNDSDGCMIVMNHEAVEKINVNKTTNSAAPEMFLKSGTKSFEFALGFFRDSPAEKEAVMFLGETQDAIFSFLKGVEWTPKISGDKTDALERETLKILDEAAAMGLPADQNSKTEAAALAAKAREAAAKGDAAAFGDFARKLEALKKTTVEALLNNYK